MTTSNFDLVKSADVKTKDIINGFIREAQSLLPNEKNTYYNIPSLVFMITFLYYNPEYFTINGVGYGISLNDDKSIAHALKDCGITVYGNILISKTDKGTHIWTFKITEPDQEAIMTIGIKSSGKKSCTSTNENVFYGYQSYGGGGYHSDPDRKIQGYRAWSSSYTSLGDDSAMRYGICYSDAIHTVKMEVNMDNKTLGYFVDDEYQGIAFKDIAFDNGEQYKMYVSIEDPITIKLTDYQHLI